MSLSRTLQYAFIAIVTLSVGFSLYQWNASRASTNKTAPNNGLVGYWSFDEGSGTQAGDASGNGNTGTLTNGPTWVAGKLGQALSFDGVNDYVFLGNVSTEATDYTVSLWYWYLQGSTAGDVFSRGRSSACFYNPRFYVDASGWLPIESGCSGDGYLNVVPLHNGWNHLVMTRSGQTAKTYLDGVLKQTDGSQPGGLGTNNSKTLIGNEYVSYSPDVFAGTLSGSVDEVRIYNRALNGTEVTNLYNLGAAKLNTSPTASLTSGLVGYWTFDGKDTPWSSSSAGTATDRSGNSNTGTLTNMSRATSPAEGKLGQALNFDGTDDYVIASGNPVSLQLTTAFTLSGWIKASTNTSDYRTIVSRENTATDRNYWLALDTGTGILSLRFSVAGVAKTFTSSVALADNSWHHVVATYNGSFVNIYSDGVSVMTPVAQSGSIDNPAATSLRIGTQLSTRYFIGSIDEVRIYNRALSVSEVQSLYDLGASDKVNSSVSQNQGTGRLDSGLAGYWKLDDGSGTTATDSSTNANNGTLTGGPTWGTGKIGGATDFTGTQYITDTSLKGYWSFNGADMNGTTAYDRSGAGNNGTLTNGPTITEGKLGQALNFDGTNDLVDVGDISGVESQSAVTLSAWVKPNVLVDFASIASKYVSSTSDITLQESGAGISNNSAIIAAIRNGSDTYGYTGTGKLSAGTWTFVSMVFDGTQTGNANRLKIYVNGVNETLTFNGTIPATTINNAQNLLLGRTGSAFTYFNGSLDEVRIYNRALSATEVAALYNSGR